MFLTAMLWGSLAGAELPVQTSSDKALSAFNAGDFERALSLVTEGPERNDLPREMRVLRHIMAAEILSARIMLGQTDSPKGTAKQARTYAEAALELTPDNQSAQLQYIVADGLVTRLTSPFKVWRKKLSSKTLAKIDSYRASYPADPRGQALLAAWHLGVIEKAGAKNGEKWFNASHMGGIELYEEALEQAPNDTVLAAHYFLALASTCNENISVDDRLMSLSQKISDMPAPTALERGMVEFVDNLTPLIGQRKALEKQAQAILAGRPL